MKIFLYKVLTIFVLIFLVYKLTIGHTVKLIENKIHSIYSKENAENLKEKIRNEIKVGLKKDRYLSKEDANLINEFINKIKNDLNTK